MIVPSYRFHVKPYPVLNRKQDCLSCFLWYITKSFIGWKQDKNYCFYKDFNNEKVISNGRFYGYHRRNVLYNWLSAE
jgi:hypothetical protein